ncbi:S-layer homology domain-containing protein [Syntrophomonas erecta]
MKNQRWISVVALLMFLVTAILPGQALAARSFSDTNGHWANSYIERLSTLGYINGYPNGTFKPDQSMSRAEFTTALINCMEVKPSNSSVKSFEDMAGHWAINYINEAVKRGILIPSEYPRGLDPNGDIKRSEASVMLVRALGQQPDNGTLPFTDSDTVERSMYKGYIKKAYDLGLIAGFPDGSFEPFREMTRAQVCTVLTKFIDQPQDKDSTPTPNSPVYPDTGSTGTLKYIAVGEQLFDLKTSPVAIRSNFNDIPVNTLTVSGNTVLANNSLVLGLTSSSNPDIVINNTRYGISRLSVSGDKLVIYPSYRKINTLTEGSYRYNSDFIKLYINSAATNDYLSDMEIIDEEKVLIHGHPYYISQDKLTIELRDDFYDIKSIRISDTDVTLKLSETDPVVYRGMYMSDISAIFSGTQTLELGKIDRIEFIIDGDRYRMSEVTIDASTNFTVNRKTYAPDKVVMVIDDRHYKINHVQLYDEKFIFYCEEKSDTEWVIFNNEYRDYDDIKIVKDMLAYDLDRVLVVSRNLIRIGGKQYEVDSSVKCQVNNKIYDIKSIDYDTSKNAVVIRASESKDAFWASQPVKFVFLDEDEYKLKDGADDSVTIYVDRKWITFDRLLIPDPSRFTYDGSSYDLIGARVMIKNTEYKIVDTAWHGRTQVLDLYLRGK